MTNHFLQIWLLVKGWLTHVEARTWHLLLSLAALALCSQVFVWTNEIPEADVEVRFLRECGQAEMSRLALDFRINNGIFSIRDSLPRSMFYFRLKNGLSRWRPNVSLDVSDSIKTEFRSVFGNDPNIEHIHFVYHYVLGSKYQSRAWTTRHNFRMPPFSRDGFWGYGYSHCEHKNGWTSITNHVKIAGLSERADTLNSHIYGYLESLMAFPSIWTMWDISQKTYRLRLDTDAKSVSRISFDFFGPAEFLPMDPEPDVVTMSGFLFTDSLKVAQIRRKGLTFHAKFAQTENLQNLRGFALTTFITLFFTLAGTLAFRIGKEKWLRWRDRRRERRA